MASATTNPQGSASRWGPLWGARPRDWAVNEEKQLPTYEEGIRRVGLEAGQRVLEVGCGTGVFLRAAADRGAQVVGLDASASLLELARERVPEAELHLGDMQLLPFADDSFDVVAGFNSFFFAEDMVAAMREAGRVARPGAPVVIQVWGRAERNSLEAMKRIARPYFPPPPPGAASAPALWEPGVLEGIATAAGLTPGDAFDISLAYEFSDDEALASAMLSVAGLASIADAGEVAGVRAAILEALAPYRTADGGYRLKNEFHFLIAAA
jgi:SAM-dependent methyltransferase